MIFCLNCRDATDKIRDVLIQEPGLLADLIQNIKIREKYIEEDLTQGGRDELVRSEVTNFILNVIKNYVEDQVKIHGEDLPPESSLIIALLGGAFLCCDINQVIQTSPLVL